MMFELSFEFMLIPIGCLELYIDVMRGEQWHVSTNPPTWTRMHARVGVLG